MKRALLLCVLLTIAGAGVSAAYGQAVDDSGAPENFLWLFGDLYRDESNFENLLAFARRHDLLLIFAPASVTEDQVETSGMEEALRKAREHGLTAWLNTGVFRAQDGWPTAEVILKDASWRARYKKQLQDIVSAYLAFYPGGTLITGHEDPLFSNWPADSTANLKRYGAQMFQLQREAVKELDPTADVAPFVLPYRMGDVYPVVIPQLVAAGAMPDFTFIDKYRGYGDPRHGLERNGEQTRALILEAKRLTHGKPVYFLAPDHTINTGYTPSKEAIRGDVESALASDVAGMGWYIRTRYVKTKEVSTLGGTVEPFLPNVGEVDEGRYNTFTGDRDRFLFAYLSTFERQGLIEPEGRFDLWVHGTDLDLHEARLFLRTAGGEWEYIGDLGTYVGGENPYSLDGKTGAVVFRALERARFLRPGRSAVEARIVARQESDGLEIRGIYAMPYNETREYVTEQEAAALLASDAESVRSQSVAERIWREPVRLERGRTLEAGLNPSGAN